MWIMHMIHILQRRSRYCHVIRAENRNLRLNVSLSATLQGGMQRVPISPTKRERPAVSKSIFRARER